MTDEFLNQEINLEWLDDYLEIKIEEGASSILVLRSDGIKEETITYNNEVLYLVYQNKEQRLGDLDCLSDIEKIKNKDLKFYPKEYLEMWLEEKDYRLSCDELLKILLGRSLESFIKNKTFHHEEVFGKYDYNVSFTGNKLFIKVYRNIYYEELYIDTIIKIQNSESYWIFDKEGLQKFKKLITSSFNPVNIVKKAAKKLNIKDFRIKTSFVSPSTYLIVGDKTIIRVSNHVINANLVKKHGHNLPKFDLLFDNKGWKWAEFRYYGGVGTSSAKFWQWLCTPIEFKPNFI